MLGDMVLSHGSLSYEQHQVVPEPEVIVPCYLVNNLSSITEEQCKFMIDNKCLEEESLVDYVSLVYCELGHELRYASMILLLFLVVVLFATMASIADEFLCPSLITVVKNLRMSDSLAGVTLLAFGNACPDIFSSLAAASDDRSRLIVGELLGAGIFCTSVVSGIIFVKHHFRLACRPVLRDTTFYLLAVYLIWYHCYEGKITFYTSLSFIVLYIIYLIVALGGQAINSQFIGQYPIAEKQSQAENSESQIMNGDWYKWREESLRRKQVIQTERKLEKTALTSSYPPHIKHSGKVEHPLATSIQVISTFMTDSSQITPGKAFNEVGVICSPSTETNTLNGCVNKAFVIDSTESIGTLDFQIGNKQGGSQQLISKDVFGPQSAPKSEARTSINSNEIEQFLLHLCPIDSTEWADSGFFGKSARVIRAPLIFVAKLTVPVVDRDKPNGNWCRILSLIQCITVPIMLHWVVDKDDSWIVLGIPIKFYALIVGLLLALVLLRTTKAFEPPKYQPIFAYFGFLMSICWTYLLATEIISLLKTVGIMFSLSDTAIGLGILAWGNSLGDIMSNTSLADAGYPRMAIGASIGAPLLNLLLGFGLAFTLSLKPGQVSLIEYSPTITLLCSTLAIILMLLMISTLVPAHKSRKPFGFALIAGYGIFFMLAVLFEYEIINFR